MIYLPYVLAMSQMHPAYKKDNIGKIWNIKKEEWNVLRKRSFGHERRSIEASIWKVDQTKVNLNIRDRIRPRKTEATIKKGLNLNSLMKNSLSTEHYGNILFT